MQSQALAPGAAEPIASLPRRSLAWILDVVLVTLLIFVAVSILDAVVGPTVSIHPEAATLEDVVQADLGMVVLDAVLATAVSAAYFVLPWVLLGASPGQLALGMRVRAGGGGGPVPLGRALARWILLFPPFATVSALTAGQPVLGVLVWSAAVAWYLVLLLTTARSASRQGLHDRVAATVVRRRVGAVDVR
ncbi:MAG: RDD family protein [Gaiellaceae bacterium]